MSIEEIIAMQSMVNSDLDSIEEDLSEIEGVLIKRSSNEDKPAIENCINRIRDEAASLRAYATKIR